MEIDEQVQAVDQTLATEMLADATFQDVIAEHEPLSFIAAYVIHTFREQK